MRDNVCRYCKRQLMSIDYYGDTLIGCIDCNRWGRHGDKKLIMQLREDDLDATAGEHKEKAMKMVG
jgi:hypothetical protein